MHTVYGVRDMYTLRMYVVPVAQSDVRSRRIMSFLHHIQKAEQHDDVICRINDTILQNASYLL